MLVQLSLAAVEHVLRFGDFGDVLTAHGMTVGGQLCVSATSECCSTPAASGLSSQRLA